ncbi:MAG: extracellular solute-binding protein [Kineosporiaceae bacterium]|nr:extracellular solute-binding protein [Kineosporiaceae bacterium]
MASQSRSVRARRPRAWAGLVAAALLATGLAACGTESGPPTLSWYINPDSGGQAEIAGRCTAATQGRYRIETTLLPREASAQREQLVRRLAANDSSIDLMSLDPPFIPEFAEAGFLAEIPEDVATEVTDGVVESAVQGSTWEGRVVTVPFWANTQLLWYRKSVAQAAGLDLSGPVTWDQLIEAATAQNTTIAAQGIRAEALTVLVNAVVASAGGTIVLTPDAPPDEVELGIDDARGRRAAEVIQNIANSAAAGPALNTRNEDASATLFEQGAAAFMVNWPFVFPRGQGAVEDGTLTQSALDDYGWALYPAVDAGTPSAPPYGGINLGIGAFSEHPDLALEAAQCIVSAENQAYYFVTNGNPAALESVYDDQEVVQAFPMASTIRESLRRAAPRPQTPYYNEVSSTIQRTWHPLGSVNPATTPARTADIIRAVLRKEDLL